MELAQAERQLNLTEYKRLKLLELENSELKRANEISLKVAALFAQAEHAAFGERARACQVELIIKHR